jgi:hypothetical protein
MGIYTSGKMPKTYVIKIRPEHYRAIISGAKRAAIRLNDRDYAVGDTVIKRVYENGQFTGEQVAVLITHIIANTPSFAPFVDNYICFSFEVKELPLC